MARLRSDWRALEFEQRVAALGALALFVTMFFPWYGLQYSVETVNRKTGVTQSHPYSHSVSAFGDVSFVEAAIFLVAVAVLAMLIARVEGREFHLPGGDGTIVMVAGGWATLLVFYRVFSRPAGGGYPVSIEWGFFLAFVASGGLAYAGWRMRAAEHGASHGHHRGRTPAPDPAREGEPVNEPPPHRTLARDLATAAQARARRHGGASAGGAEEPNRPRFPPAPAEQMSFEDQPPSD
jgi:hypothetical protein